MLNGSWRVQHWLDSRHLMIVRGLLGGDEERIGKAGSDGKSGKGGDQKKNATWAERNNTYQDHGTYGSCEHCPCHYISLSARASPLRRSRNQLTLNAFPIRLTRFVTGKLPLQCARKRALPVGEG